MQIPLSINSYQFRSFLGVDLDDRAKIPLPKQPQSLRIQTLSASGQHLANIVSRVSLSPQKILKLRSIMSIAK